MHPFIRISLVLLNSVTLFSLSACQNRAPSLRMLDSRAGYSSVLDDEEVGLYQRGRQTTQSLARKSAPRVAKVYVYPHELPTKDFFWGGWISLVITQDEWIFESPADHETELAPNDEPSAIRRLHKDTKIHKKL